MSLASLSRGRQGSIPVPPEWDALPLSHRGSALRASRGVLVSRFSSSLHLCVVRLLQDVALHQYLTSSPPLPHRPLIVACQMLPYFRCFSFFTTSSSHFLLGRPLKLFRVPGCHGARRLASLSSHFLAICPCF